MRTLVFGATGSLGSSILSCISGSGGQAIGLSRSSEGGNFLSLASPNWIEELADGKGPYSAVFAQGANLNDSITEPSELRAMLESNLVFVVEKISELLKGELLGNGSSIVILSSVWQEFSRPNKLSYTVSKSAIKGLVGSLVADLSPRGIRVNAVLPGVIESPMTRAMLPQETLIRIQQETPMKEFATEADVSRTVLWLISKESRGVVGQFIRVDNGWSNVRLFP